MKESAPHREEDECRPKTEDDSLIFTVVVGEYFPMKAELRTRGYVSRIAIITLAFMFICLLGTAIYFYHPS